MDNSVMTMEQEPDRISGPCFLERLPVWVSRTMPGWLPQQRWFGSKGRPIPTVTVRAAALLPSAAGPMQALVLADAHFGDERGDETYFLPVCLLDESNAASLDPGRAMARVPASSSTATLADGVADPDLRRNLLAALTKASGSEVLPEGFRFERTHNSQALFSWLDALAATGSSRLLRAEQSNTSMVFSGADQQPRLLLKCFRRVMPGLNPDYEITRALTEQTSFRSVPLLAGSILWQPSAESEPWILGIFQAFVANQGDGWEYTLHELKSVLAEGDHLRRQQLFDAMRQLARRTGELHLALAGITDDPAISPESISEEDLRAWEEQIAAQMKAAARELKDRLDGLPAPWRHRAADVAENLAAAKAAALPASLVRGVHKVRIHGDYHLGQVLRTDSDFVLFDFEGEPARPLEWRRRKWCVLKDVAGMLRSFGYAAHVAAAAAPGQEEAALQWEQSARREFWREWEELVRRGNPSLLPESEHDTSSVLRVFELEKAIYELNYELHHRPDWVGVPLAALERLLKPGASNQH